MLSLTKSLTDEPEFRRLVAGIEAGACPAVISGLSEIHRAHAAAAIRALTMRPVAVLCAAEDEAARIAQDIATLSMEQALTLNVREFTFHSAEVVSRQIEQSRIATLEALVENKAPIVVMSISGALQRTIPAQQLMDASLTLKIGNVHDPIKVTETLVMCGYSRSEQVEGPGQFALRGGILDFFSPVHDEPVRCEFFGDEIDSMGYFDVLSQRRTENIDQARIAPVAETLPTLCSAAGFDETAGTAVAGETAGTAGSFGTEGLVKELGERIARLEKRRTTNPELLKNLNVDVERLATGRSFPAADRYMELIYPMATALDYLREDTVVIICEPLRLKERAESYQKLLAEDCLALLESGVLESGLVRFAEDWAGFLHRIEDFPVVMTDSFVGSSYPLRPRMTLNISTKRLPSYGGSMETAASDIAHYKESGFRTVILSQDKRRAGLLREYLEEHGITSALDYALQSLPNYGNCVITEGDLSAGMEYTGIKLAVITEGQIIAQAAPRRVRKTKKQSNRERLQSFTDLSPGDLVVHDQHGIGRFVGFFKMPVDGIQKDYVKISYAGTDNLYVPATQLDLVAKYIGAGTDGSDEDGGGGRIKLSKLGGADWSKVKSKAKSAAKEMARELIKLYAARQRLKGLAFPADTVWQTEFEEKFGYQETDDQLKCVQEIKADMEKPVPMDRLLCGDVGYGKTEVALRAVMKCVLGGYQAAILVPTTVLAQQHYVTSMRRFAGYPVNIEVLSRFRSPAQIKKALRDMENGGVDFVIGTHRLLQKDVNLKKLGLLVVDEEQRLASRTRNG